MDWMHTRGDDVRLISPVVRKWRQHLDLSVFIYTYEGHTWERGYCWAIRERFPQARLIGYQHSTLSPMYLSHFISEKEQGKVPFPDRVVTNGLYHYEMLQQNGVPEQVLSLGGAFRYGPSIGKTGMPVFHADRSHEAPIHVLAALSIFETQAAELLMAAMAAFADPKQFRVLLKFHPSLPASRVAAAAGLALHSIPSHLQVRDEPISTLFAKSDVLIYTDTTAAVEALAYGVPLVHLQSDHAIDMDRLGSFDGSRASVGTAEGLREAVRAVVNVSGEEHAARIRRWREVVDLLLPQPDGKMIDLFMPDGLREKPSGVGHIAENVQ